MSRLLLISLLIPFLKISAQWSNLNPIPESNDIWSVHFMDNYTGWMVGTSGFIKKTIDGGENWFTQECNLTKTLKSVRFINHSVGIICGNEGKILKTTDGGVNWLEIYSGTQYDLNSISFLSENLIYIAGHKGVILKSIDSGISWNTTTIDTSIKFKSIYFINDSIGFVLGLFGELYKTTNGGESWLNKSFLINPGNYRFNIVFFINADTGWIGAGDEYENSGLIFFTTDGGDSWNQKNLVSFKNSEIKKNQTEYSDDSYGVRDIFFLDDSKGYAVAGTGGGWSRSIFITTNGGTNWINKYYNLEESGLLSVKMNSNGVGLACGFNGIIFTSTNYGDTWSQIFSGGVKYGGAENINTMIFVSDSIGFAAGSRGSFNYYGDQILKTTNGGKIWKTIRYNYSSSNQFTTLFFLDEFNGWAGSEEYLLFTSNSGTSWNLGSSGFGGIKSICFNDLDFGFILTDYGVNKSTDGGQTWVQKTTPGGNSIFFIDQNTGWVVGNSGSIGKSSDGGETWTTISAGVTSNLNSVRFKNINLGAICGDNGTVLITTDGGQTWILRITNINENLNSIIFKDENSLWCAGNNGIILESNNLGVNWIVHNGLTDKNLKCLIRKPDNSIFIAGEKGSMLRYSAGTNPAQPYFSKVWSGNPYLPMNIYITSASVDGATLKAGDEIGVFDGDICVGSVILNDSIPSGGFISLVVSMDDPTTTEIDGFIPNDTITFRIWDSQLQEEITYVEANYLQSSGRFLQQGTAVVELNSRLVINQTIALSGGWNIVSLKTEPLNKNLINVFEPLIASDILIKVLDETGNAIEKLPPPIGWINNIGNWAASEGYYTKIHPNSSATLITAGFKINLPFNIPLTAGWNIVSYPLDAEQNAISILQELINLNHLIKVQDEAGNAIEYLPSPIGWINNIGNFKPGEGYYIKVSQNTVLTYNTPSKKIITDKKKVIAEERAVSQEQLNTVWSGNPYLPMNIYITNLSNQTSGILSPGDEIGIFDNEFCVGVKLLTNQNFIQGYIQIITSADDPTTDFTDGFSSGNPIIIKLWDSESNQIIDINSFTLISGNQSFEPLGTSVISFESVIPVELVNFRATVSNNTVELNWETKSETNNRGFGIERNQKSKVKSHMEWESIGFVEGKGTTTETQMYSFTDNNLKAGNYAYRLKQIDVDGAFIYSNEIEVNITAPNEFALYQNFPNPFNPVTKIRYSIPGNVETRCGVSLRVYDILGNEVSTLVDEFKEPGVYEVEFDASNLTSGVYVYRLKTDAYNDIKKMILLK